MANQRDKDLLRRYFQRLEYPVYKDTLLDRAKTQELADDIFDELENLPSREFHSADEVLEHLRESRRFEDEGRIGDGGLDRHRRDDEGLFEQPGLEDRGGIEALQRTGKVLKGDEGSEKEFRVRHQEGMRELHPDDDHLSHQPDTPRQPSSRDSDWNNEDVSSQAQMPKPKR